MFQTILIKKTDLYKQPSELWIQMAVLDMIFMPRLPVDTLLS